MAKKKPLWQVEFENQVEEMSNDTLLTNLTNISESIGGELHFGTPEYRRDGIRQQVMREEVARRMRPHRADPGVRLGFSMPTVGYERDQDERSKFRGL